MSLTHTHRSPHAAYVSFGLLSRPRTLVADYFICCHYHTRVLFESLLPTSISQCPDCGHMIDYTGNCDAKYTIVVPRIREEGHKDVHKRVMRNREKERGTVLVFPFWGGEGDFWTWEPPGFPERLGEDWVGKGEGNGTEEGEQDADKEEEGEWVDVAGSDSDRSQV